MKRKVNLVGQNTLTVSLPTKWVKDNNIKKGDEIEIIEESVKLVLHSGNHEKKLKRVVLNIDGLDKLILNRYIDEFYRAGVEEIVLKFSTDKLPDHKHHKDESVYKIVDTTVQRLIGLEVISQKGNTIILQSLITKDDVEKIDVIEHRIFFLIKEFLDEFIKALELDFDAFHEKSYGYHDSIAKFTYYYFRILNFSDRTEGEKIRFFGLFNSVDLLMDKVRHTSERVVRFRMKSKKLKTYLKEIFTYFLEQFDMVFNKNILPEDIDAIVRKRYALVERVNSEKFSDEEAKALSECKIMLDIINQFCEAYVARNMNKYLDG